MAMVLLPVVFFLVLEGVLRAFEYGDDYQLFNSVPTVSGYLYQNPAVARRYFSNLARVPTGLGDAFRARKDTTEFRIFVQGGSSAAGYPYYAGGSFSRMLEQRLQQTFPDRTVTVVNTGLAAVNSYTLLDFADEIIEQEPDVVLIYAGHNEFYGALGVASAESLGQFRSVVNLFLRLRKLRTVQALQSTLASGVSLFTDGAGAAQSDGTLMERMVGRQHVPYGSTLYRRGLAQFRGNLGALLARYRRQGIPVLVGTIASNERGHAPFISGLSRGTDEDHWNVLYSSGAKQLEHGELDSALVAYDELVRVDSLSADAFFARAQTLDGLGRYAEARSSYISAKDRDELRFRGSEDINAIIREEAASKSAVVVETQARLAVNAIDGIIGSDLMLEHLHPNIDGYFIIADAYYEALREEEMVGAWNSYVPASSARSEILVTAVDSLYGQFRLQQLMSQWPFQPAGVVDRSIETIQARDSVERFALDLHQRKISWYDATTALRSYYKNRGDLHHALKAALAVIQQYPFLPRPYAEAADILLRQRRLDEALTYFDAANSREESATVYFMIGSIYFTKRQPEQARQALERALDLQPQYPQALLQLSRVQFSNNEPEDALVTVRRLLDIAPGDPGGRQMLQMLSQRVETVPHSP